MIYRPGNTSHYPPSPPPKDDNHVTMSFDGVEVSGVFEGFDPEKHTIAPEDILEGTFRFADEIIWEQTMATLIAPLEERNERLHINHIYEDWTQSGRLN